MYGNESPPLQGLGQGNGLAPTGFGLLSTKIFRAMEAAGHGLQLLSAISWLLLTIIGFAFVDDADLVDGARDVRTPGEALIADFQQALSRWCGLLWATGGLIVTSKSKWWLVDFEWTG